MKFAVVDDNKEFLEHFYKLTIPYIRDNEIDFYDSPIKFLKNISRKEKMYDALFLDIDMPTINGIELSKKIFKDYNRNCLIIYITNKKEMVYEAFGINVISFVYKPDFELKIKEIFNSLYTILDFDKTVIISSTEGKKKVKIKDIFYIKKDLRKVVLCINGKDILYTNYKNLMDIDNIIDNPSFVYVNRSVKINLQHVNRIHNDTVYLNNGEKYDISRSKTKEITKMFVETSFSS